MHDDPPTGKMQRCPECKSYDVSKVSYGLPSCDPVTSDAVRADADRGDIPDVLEREITGRRGYRKTVHGGCCVGPPEWTCGQCWWQWPPRAGETRIGRGAVPWTERVFCPECGGLEC